MIRVGSPSNTYTEVNKLNDSRSISQRFTCWYTNADSLINKLDELKSRINLYSPDVICITEVFPKHCIYSVTAVELQISGYDCFCSDFSHHVRGICVYIKSKYKAHKLETITTQFQEAVCSVALIRRY